MQTKAIIFLIIAFALIFSFISHDIVPHHHPHEIFGSGIGAAFHGNDRKWWDLLLLAFIFVAVNLLKKWKLDRETEKIFSLCYLNLQNDILKIFNPIFQALRTGILNTKLCD